MALWIELIFYLMQLSKNDLIITDEKIFKLFSQK